MDLKNLGLDALGGTIKGTFGTAFSEWGKKLLKMDSKVVKKVAGTLLGTTFGTGVDVGTALIAGREINLIQSFQQNLIQSGMGQLFEEPIDAASGAFLITTTDFMLMDIYGAVKVQRKYNSTSMQTGVLGQGWEFTCEGCSTRTGTNTTLHCATAIDIRSRGRPTYFGRIKEERIERKKKQMFNCLKGALFLILGVALLIIPYSRFKKFYPAVPTPLVVRILGVVIVLCGVVILAAALVYGE